MESAEFRRLFPILDEITWFNTPSSAPAAGPVVQRMRDELQGWSTNGLDWPQQDGAANRARTAFAKITGFEPDQVALVQSVAEAVSTIAASFDSADVVIGTDEYRSLLYPWLNSPGARLHQVEMTHGQLSATDVAAAITPQTDIVAVSWVQSGSGSRVDLLPIRQRCDAVGARLLVDGTQAVGVLEFDPQARPDFLVVHGYKWLLAPRGAAWLAARPEHGRHLKPLAPSNKSAPGSWTNFYGGPLELREDLSRLDASLSWPPWAGADAALEIVRGLPRGHVERHCLHLANLLRTAIHQAGWNSAPTELPSHIVSFTHPDPDALLSQLRAESIRLTVRNGLVRVGLHYFNTEQDLHKLLHVLGQARPEARNLR